MVPPVRCVSRVPPRVGARRAQRVEVEQSDLRAGLATLTFVDRWLVLPDALHEGLAVEIDLGWQDAHAVVFRGQVSSVRCAFPRRGAARVLVEAVDALVRLGLAARTRRWWNADVKDVVTQIAIDNGLRCGRIEPGQTPTFSEERPLRQVEETDLALLYRLAADYDCKVFVRHVEGADELGFVATAGLLAAAPVDHELAFNGNVIELETSAESFAADPVERLVTTDPHTGAPVEITQESVAVAETGWVPDPERIARLGEDARWIAALLEKSTRVRTDLVATWRTQERVVGAASRPASDPARALGDGARRLGQSARGRATGSVVLEPRRRVRLAGFGGRWSGDWYLATVRHEVDVTAGSYTTSFAARR